MKIKEQIQPVCWICYKAPTLKTSLTMEALHPSSLDSVHLYSSSRRLDLWFQIKFKMFMSTSTRMPRAWQTRRFKMAARGHEVAPLCPNWMVFSCFLCVETVYVCYSSSQLHASRHTYSHEFLLDIRRTTLTNINPANAKKLHDCGLLQRPAQSHNPQPPTPAKRGKRGGIRTRLVASSHGPAIPTITLVNIRTINWTISVYSGHLPRPLGSSVSLWRHGSTTASQTVPFS